MPRGDRSLLKIGAAVWAVAVAFHLARRLDGRLAWRAAGLLDEMRRTATRLHRGVAAVLAAGFPRRSRAG